MNRHGFTLVHQQGTLTLKIYGAKTANSRFTSFYQSSAGVVVFLGRLFYRQDLLNRLGSAQLSDQPSVFKQNLLSYPENDAALVMAAYELWGQDAFTYFEGDFALAIYDSRDHVLIGLRDTLGGYPLYYTSNSDSIAIGTSLGPLTHLLSRAVVSGDGLADYLLLRTFGFQQPDSDASIFEGVSRVRVGQVVRLSLDSGRVERNNYWNWIGAVNNINIAEERPEAIYDQFASLLSDAVRERCTDITAAQFSGGMDSTSVALLASELLSSHGSVHTISLVYERWRALSQETPFIQEALDAYPGLVSHLLPADDIHDFARFPTPPPTDEPWPGLYRVATEIAMYDVAASVGASSILTGAGGDEIGDLLPLDVADRLRRGRPWDAWQIAAQWAAGQNRNVWHVFRPYGLVPLTPALLRGGLSIFLRHGRAGWRDLNDYWIPPWIRADFAQKHDLYDRVLCNMRRAHSFDPSLQVSESLNMIISRNGDMMRWYLGAPRGIHTGNPFLDPRVFRYGLAARTRIPFCPNRQKPLLADAMRGVLPDSIRNRRRKGSFSEAYFLGLSRCSNYLEAMIENAPVGDLAFLDKEMLLKCFRDYQMARSSNEHAAGRMDTTLAVLNWLSHYQNWIHILPPVSNTLQWSARSNAQFGCSSDEHPP